MFLDFSVSEANDVEGIVFVCGPGIGRIDAGALPHKHHVITSGEAHHRRLGQQIRNGLWRGAPEKLHKGIAAGRNVRVVQNVIFGLIFWREIHMARKDDFAPPVEHQFEIGLFTRGHRRCGLLREQGHCDERQYGEPSEPAGDHDWPPAGAGPRGVPGTFRAPTSQCSWIRPSAMRIISKR